MWEDDGWLEAAYEDEYEYDEDVTYEGTEYPEFDS